MTAAQGALLQAEIVQLLQADGFVAGTPPDFVATVWDDPAKISKLAADIAALLTKYGVPIPAKVAAVINILPLILALVH